MAENPAQDSITMAQLKQFVSTMPSKQKQEPVKFEYADMDTIPAEIDEFYSYSEVQQFVDNQETFHKNYDGEWQSSTVSEREAYAEYLLDFLDQKSDASRLPVVQQLIYISQGAYAGVKNEDDHLDWVIKNNRMLRKLGAFQIYYDALRIACSKLSEEPGIGVDIEALVTLLYMLVVSHEDDEVFMDELAATNPSLTVFLLDQICVRQVKDQFYPLKKMLLLLWKVMRTTLGGTDDLPVLKDIARRILGYPPLNPNLPRQKSDPLDYLVYQSEMSQKYPAYIPANSTRSAECPSIPISTIANVLQAKTGAGAANGTVVQTSKTISGNGSSLTKQGKSGPNGSMHGGIGMQPFIFPSSSMKSSTPKSIMEAEELFKKNMYISTAMMQVFNEKKLMTDKRYRSNHDAEDQDSGRALEYRQPASIRNKIRHRKRSVMRRASGNGNQGDDEADDASDEGDEDESDEESDRDNDAVTAAKDDLPPLSEQERERIERIEHIYREIVPRMAQIQVTLLKTLLVCIKVSGTSPAKEALNAEAEGKEPVDTFTRVNDIREHEIMAKAVSSILLLQLQHFKIYHILAFNYVCQLLVDSNCLLLLLKIFGNAENPGNIHTKNEVEEYNFFKTCSIIRQTRPGPDPDQAYLDILKDAIADIGDPLPASYVCRRNMFCVINLLRLLQKLTKNKIHRVLLLVQYKSSAILKRLLKINHPDLQKYVYKALKSQVPFLGRKWRSSHMKVITGIYLYCRSNLRDDWISGADVERDLEDALPAEQQLRNMIRHYHDRVHPNALLPDPTGGQPKSGKASGSNNYSGPKYDWQEMYEAHASIPEVGHLDHSSVHNGHTHTVSVGSRSDGEESVKSSTSSHHSSQSNNSSMSDRRRDLTLSDIELDAGFEENYEEWLEAEVFGKKPPSSLLEAPPFRYDDFYFDDGTDVPFLKTPGDGSGWDTPAVLPSDDDEDGYGNRGVFNFSRWEDEELFKQINWTPNLHSMDASVEQQYYLEEASEQSNGDVYYSGDASVDADTGVDIATSQGFDSDPDGVDGSGHHGMSARRRSRPLRVRKSDMGTEWIDEDAGEEVMQAYGPSVATHMLDQPDLNEP
ncbi:Factor arrest protein 11 [Mortierella polycephala]|uniref:Factor arrest protein 11 n=1 Tax=Mortierella polycephala TaxID=41804 RepID=A0A9P6PZR3_9FUNG|nr:Factor arrest protein 11 [Mortierella polycephala]